MTQVSPFSRLVIIRDLFPTGVKSLMHICLDTVHPQSRERAPRKSEGVGTPQLITQTMESPTVSPEQILMYGVKKPRPLLLDKNVVAYFGTVFGLRGYNYKAAQNVSSVPRRSPSVKP